MFANVAFTPSHSTVLKKSEFVQKISEERKPQRERNIVIASQQQHSET